MTLAGAPNGPTYVIQDPLNHHSEETPKCDQIERERKFIKMHMGNTSLQKKGLRCNKNDM